MQSSFSFTGRICGISYFLSTIVCSIVSFIVYSWKVVIAVLDVWGDFSGGLFVGLLSLIFICSLLTVRWGSQYGEEPKNRMPYQL